MQKNQRLIELVKNRVVSEGGPKKLSNCASMLLDAASFGKASYKNLTNACIAAEFFYQALYNHYWQGKGNSADIIYGDYYGSIAIIYASKTKDCVVLDTFCKAIQEATKNDDDDNGSAGRLAKIYGASSYVGAYLAGLSGTVLHDFYKQGEKKGLQKLNKLATVNGQRSTNL